VKIIVAGSLCLISLIATCALFGWLESSVNLIEGLKTLFMPGATTVLFTPFLVLFILLCLGVFAFGSLSAVGIGAVANGIIMRNCDIDIAPLFNRTTAFISAFLISVVIFFSMEQNAGFLLSRPLNHPASPAIVLAGLAGINAALDLMVASFIVGKLRKPRTASAATIS